jgi:hypothetical protein
MIAERSYQEVAHVRKRDRFISLPRFVVMDFWRSEDHKESGELKWELRFRTNVLFVVRTEGSDQFDRDSRFVFT